MINEENTEAVEEFEEEVTETVEEVVKPVAQVKRDPSVPPTQKELLEASRKAEAHIQQQKRDNLLDQIINSSEKKPVKRKKVKG